MIQIKALAELMQEKLNAALNSTDEESPYLTQRCPSCPARF